MAFIMAATLLFGAADYENRTDVPNVTVETPDTLEYYCGNQGYVFISENSDKNFSTKQQHDSYFFK